MKRLSEMNLHELIVTIEECMERNELSDEYLDKTGNMTHDEYGIGEYGYGIVTIPCQFVIEHLKRLEQMQN